ncbi:MAG TPA: FAD-binding protein, partial [Ktedonobacteraceae bacterium]|nr:FAD-binding protein [Ktedonobacteraceae bacterium]
AIVEPNVPLDRLITQTLTAGLVPLVVPELPGITCGGAVIGGAGESSSYKVGLFDDNCVEYEIVLGNGKVITASDTDNSDIFYSLPWSYGTLGLLSLIKMKLIPARPYVHLSYCSFDTYDDAISFIQRASHKGEHIFIDGIVFSRTKTVVGLGNFSDHTSLPIQTFSSPHDPWFYEHAREVTENAAHYEELIPITDYLFRYNRNGFWMGKVFFEFLHIPYTKLTRKLFAPYLNARAMFDAVQTLNLTRSFFIHDYVTDFEAAADLISYTDSIVGIYPIWLCPIRTFHAKEKISPTNVSREGIVLDIGIYGRSKKYIADKDGTNKKIERYATAHQSMKVLYSEVFYPEDEFWTIYDKANYDAIRRKYYAENIFPDLWNKVRSKDTITPTLSFGIPKLLLETVIGTYKNA